MPYDHQAVEKKWQKKWEEEHAFEAEDQSEKEKFFALIEFPYPSGAGLHVGHPRPYTALDVIARKRRAEGYNVLYPIGWDAFGLPTENYAIKTGRPPQDVTAENIATFKRQIKSLGISFDWSREINTTDPAYYKWTQWIFLQFFKHGLAYKKAMPINWCLSCKIGLANEEVINGACERCGGQVEKREKAQWMLAITKYADSLLEGLKEVDYIPQAKRQQENWIGKSDGALVRFDIKNESGEIIHESLEVFTTRPDTLFGVTYIVIAPEHPLTQSLEVQNKEEIKVYQEQAKNKTFIERSDVAKEKTGIEIKGLRAINLVNQESLPIFVADYVMMDYGTGAIMAVPAHDERDFAFAQKYHLSIKQVVAPHFIDPDNLPHKDKPVCRRKTVHAIIRHPKEDKILLLNWFFNVTPSRPYLHTLIIGGVEEGEDIAKAAIREAQEETGYKHFSFVKDLGLEVHTEYYAEHKDENRYAEIQVVVLQLEDEEQEIIAQEEMRKHELIWVDAKDVEKSLNVVDGPIILDLYKNGLCSFCESGIAIHSDFLNNLSTEEAKEKMILFLEEKGLGKRQTQYKLRDWVFSRQRYWGEPIPLVYCENCAKRKPKILLIHGLEGHSQENWFPWFKKEMEERGYEVLIPDLPNAEFPTLEKWLSTLKKLDIKQDDKLFLVGHSLGCLAACHFVLQRGSMVEKLILVAPTGKHQSQEHWDNLLQAGIEKSGITCIQEFNEEYLDLLKLKRFIKESVVFLSDNDPYIPLSVAEDYQPLKSTVKIFKGKSHFNESAGIKELPEIQQEFPEINTLQLGWIPLEEKELPLKLPQVDKYEPTDTGESPLSKMDEWVNVSCPRCGSSAKRETDTMPNWAGSSWYFLRYTDPHNQEVFAGKEKLDYWTPVDWYNGGMEHTVLHLLYSRFWNQFLFDIGLVPTKEPYKKRTSHGMILAKGGEKMSKSKGNVVNPDEIVSQYGADTMRTYLMFMGSFDAAVQWDPEAIVGIRRFLEKVFNLQEILREQESEKFIRALHKTIKKVTEDIETMKFNTSIAQMMSLVNQAQEERQISKISYEKLLQLLAPFAPHICEEIWQKLGHQESISQIPWPTYEKKWIKDEQMTIAIQINGRLRGTVEVPSESSSEEIQKQVLQQEKILFYLQGKPAKKVIYVKGKLISIVV